MPPQSSTPQTAPLTALPLYRQVKQMFVERLADGTWAPGTALPSEMALAAELGVSQGTVRKALDEMTTENLVIRRQGRGTFAAEPDEARVLFHFFKLTGDDGVRRFPQSTVTSVERDAATPDERAALGLDGRARIIRIARIRELDETPVIAETITVAARDFNDLDQLGTIPNNLYALYAAHYGRTVARAEERLKAINANAETARALGVESGTALLSVHRTAFSVDGRPTEFRISLCRTDRFRYEVDLR